jgi:opacity protein-like surface antigen
MRNVLVAVFVLLVVAGPAAAQERPAGVNLGGGFVFPLSGFKDVFDTGWNFSIGGTYNIAPKIGVQGEYAYFRMGGPDRTISVAESPIAASVTNGLIESNHQAHTVTFNLVYTPTNALGGNAPVGIYVLGGGGYYHRIVELTSPSVGYTTICDPYWYVCYPTLVSVDRIIGDRSSNDFGINFGAGLTFGTDAKFYVEARYHYVWGPKITADQLPAGTTLSDYSTNAQYFPLTFGVRW